jgi:DNA polymerase sigma
MSGNCEITGLSPEDVNLFSNLHSHIIGTLEMATPTKEEFAAYDKPLGYTVSNHKFNTGDIKRKDSLINHLEKSISSKFKGSKLTAFGSSESGLSLKTGDLDLCLQLPGADQKKIVKRISGMLRGQGMESVQALTRATVPIVKFTDPRSGMEVDISINNNLALHNTSLLKAYADKDERVRKLAICVKHWALHRNISDAHSGTFSSYAWSVLVINHLIKSGIIPNLQSSTDRTIVEIDEKEYDITINTDAKVDSPATTTLTELLYSFFHDYATMDWENEIISIRNGSTLSRDQKGWMNETPSALDVVNSKKEKPPRMGEHHLSIEDPFNPEHDLCRVVRAVGELKIRDELLRAAKLFGDGTSWKMICETIEPDRLQNMEPADIFHDLRDKSDDFVKEMLGKTKIEMSEVEKVVEALDSERQSNVRMAKAMRGVIEETSDLRKEHKSIIINLKERNKEIDSVKTSRDKINSDIILPIHMIEDELAKVYSRLTEEIDIHRVPSLSREKVQFSWFLELQAMHGKAREASELHQRFIVLVTEQKKEIKTLKLFETKHDEATTKLLESEPLLKDKNINAGEAKSYDRRTQNIQRALRQRRGDLHKLRRESGRLEAWLRKKSGSQSRGKGRDRQKGKNRNDKSGSTAKSSGPMTLGDISGLLSTIGTEPTAKKEKRVSAKKAGMRKLGSIGSNRGVRGQYKKKER